MAQQADKAAAENGQPSHTKKSTDGPTFTRADFFGDLQKVAKKQEQPSRRGSKKR
jgi:hypothetical protein